MGMRNYPHETGLFVTVLSLLKSRIKHLELYSRAYDRVFNATNCD
jgi:hypothetical protein